MPRLFMFVLLFVAGNLEANASETFWKKSEYLPANFAEKQAIQPQAFQWYQLQISPFRSLFKSNTEPSNIFIQIPTPEGTFFTIDVFESSMMEKSLEHKYPQIKTFTGIHTEDAKITAKFDFTEFGFHAIVFNGEYTYYIDPVCNSTTEWYVVYYKKDFRKTTLHQMRCMIEDVEQDLITEEAVSLDSALPTLSSYKTSGDTLRTYRLALACTEEYSAAVGGSSPSKGSVLSAMVTTMNRVNGVFEREFSMHANLIGNNDTLIFLPGSSDPYTNNSGSTMLGENQSTVTARIGSANYDFGHVFSTGGGGIASLACICNSNKAQGVTGSSNPVGDPFDIDYVAHEMGHQFGGSHTFNSVTGSCSGNRSSTSAYEIGSATTIMGYAGICGSDNIQPHSDDYYHIRSLEQMTGNSVKACATKVLSGNAIPQLASINKTYIIPTKTSFELTASATDADNDPLTYCWEQYNRGGSGSAWNSPTTVAPTLRSFNPSVSPTRVFPQYKELIKNTVSYLGELLPDTTRILKFRCTVRDIHNGNGSFFTSTDTTKLDVRSTGSNLFRVNSQNTFGQSFNAYSLQTVTWNVAGTNAAPFSVSNVDIFLSIDSGKTWPYTLATGTPNDGSEQIGLPNVSTKWARIKVKGSNNVFFDLNDEWISIVPAPAGLINTSSMNGLSFVSPNPSNGNCILYLPQNTPSTDLQIFNIYGQKIWSANNINSSEYSLTLNNLAVGLYTLHVIHSGSKQTEVIKLIKE